MKRSKSVFFAGALILAATGVSAASCEKEHSDYQEVCYEKATEIVVDEKECDSDPTGSRFVYVWYPYGSVVPTKGTKLTSGYVTTKPVGASISRGGFGRVSTGGGS